MVETASDDILADAANVDVAFLVVGDPFGYANRLVFPQSPFLT
jgi:diphthine synthase